MRPMGIGLAMLCCGLGLVTACGGDAGATGPRIALSQTELFTLADELSGAMSPSSLPGLGAGDLGSSIACPNGGTASSAGSYTGTSSVTAGATVTFSGCRTTHYTTDGSLRVTAAATSSPSGTTAVEARAAGTLQVTTSDGRSGSCPVDVSASTAASGTATPLVQVTGSACGINVSGRY